MPRQARDFYPEDAQILRNRLAALPGHSQVKAPAPGEEPLRMTSQIRVLKATLEYVRAQLDRQPTNLRAVAKKWGVGFAAISTQLNELDNT